MKGTAYKKRKSDRFETQVTNAKLSSTRLLDSPSQPAFSSSSFSSWSSATFARGGPPTPALGIQQKQMKTPCTGKGTATAEMINMIIWNDNRVPVLQCLLVNIFKWFDYKKPELLFGQFHFSAEVRKNLFFYLSITVGGRRVALR